MKKLIFTMLALVCFTACTNDDENGLDNNNGTMIPGEEEGRAVELNDTTLTLYPDTDKDTVNVGAEGLVDRGDSDRRSHREADCRRKAADG